MFSGLSTGLEVADMAWEVKCREEDMAYRAVDIERRCIDDARRAVDEKSQQLKAISHLSALIAGFAMVVMVEVTLPEDLNGFVLVAFGGMASLVVGLMLLAMVNCTLMLVAILKYDCIKREIPFEDFWRKRCEQDWQVSYKAFTWGVPCFLSVLALLGWVVFHDQRSGRVEASTVVSVVAALTVLVWTVHTQRKWGDFLLAANGRLFKGGHGVD